MRGTKLSRVQSDVVAKIIDYIRREKLPVDSRLAESQLAKEVGVSRSPIRAALQLLAEQGIVISAANKGHYLARDGSTLDAIDLPISPPPDASLYDRIGMDRIRDTVPEQFTEASFMRRYGVSRAQLVRTLTKMSQDGLLKRSTGHGWTFTPSLNSAQAYAASYRFRIIVEPAGLTEPTFVLDRSAMARCREAHEQMLLRAKGGKLSGRGIFDTNAKFHEALAAMSGNLFIAQAIEHQNKLRQLSEYYVYEDEVRIHTLVREHFEIMDALLAGDQSWAATLLRRHLEIASRLAPPFAGSSPEPVP